MNNESLIKKWKYAKLINENLDILRQEYMAINLEKLAQHIRDKNLILGKDINDNIFEDAKKILLYNTKPLDIDDFIKSHIELINKRTKQHKNFEIFKQCFPNTISEKVLEEYFWKIYDLA